MKIWIKIHGVIVILLVIALTFMLFIHKRESGLIAFAFMVGFQVSLLLSELMHQSME